MLLYFVRQIPNIKAIYSYLSVYTCEAPSRPPYQSLSVIESLVRHVLYSHLVIFSNWFILSICLLWPHLVTFLLWRHLITFLFWPHLVTFLLWPHLVTFLPWPLPGPGRHPGPEGRRQAGHWTSDGSGNTDSLADTGILLEILLFIILPVLLFIILLFLLFFLFIPLVMNTTLNLIPVLIIATPTLAQNSDTALTPASVTAINFD